MSGQKKTENILYAALWAFLFTVPVLLMYFSLGHPHASATRPQPDWQGAFNAWQLMSLFCLTFYVHNFFMAPLLVYRKRPFLYALLTVLLIGAFIFAQSFTHRHTPPEDRVMEMKQGPGCRQTGMETFPAHRPDMPQQRRKDPPPRPNEPEPPIHMIDGRDTVAFIIATLLLALNIGAKHYFKTRDERKRFTELERESLTRQLEYLKYQINPHFFMNTLNNIHALVDIDPEKAKYTIEVLSKLMRYVLYEGNHSMAPLQKEIDFINHYIDLMHIRYTDRVRISVDLPAKTPDCCVPSLLFTTFVENAFKHGVSYTQDSFIEVGMHTDDTHLFFAVRNSRIPSHEESHGGVGLANAAKRLQLIYADNYQLDIKPEEHTYSVSLTLPLAYSCPKNHSTT